MGRGRRCANARPGLMRSHPWRGIGEACARAQLRRRVVVPRVARADALACGECAACRYAVAGQHPDLMRLELLLIDQGRTRSKWSDSIGIDRVRGAHRIRAAYEPPPARQGRRHCAGRADECRWRPSAIENAPGRRPEPISSWFPDEPQRMPATLRSRCRKLAQRRRHGRARMAVFTRRRGARPGPPPRRPGRASAHRHRRSAVQDERRAATAALGVPERLSVTALAARIDAGGGTSAVRRLAHALRWLLCLDRGYGTDRRG